ncbi:carboxypeptidase-like regulatory domain-containing protein [Neolewinella persica]|uniref:carboxypeptidase-like regulatory domain-containing protein n=1 Tax=Neolewinella persica TaxID=70998 RepID=UPI00036627FA|nr:carboxypeptidase-like regulatory domain-containing protein [Neolewinella persica]
MRFILFLILLVSHTVYAQTTLMGTVTDETNSSPLHFATIAVVGQPYGTLSDADGNFVLTSPITLNPKVKIQVSFLGYATREFTLSELRSSGDVLLSTQGVDLPMANVRAANSEPLTEISLGRSERKAFTFYQSIFEQTYQLATRISNPGKRTGMLSSVRYYFGKAAKKGKPVRINFYAIDPSCDCPGKALHTGSIIPEKTKKGWNKLDLTENLVLLPATDFFLSFEWLGLSNTKSAAINFSVGMVPDQAAQPIYEKVGGSSWQESVKRGAYRPLVRIQGKVE